jgi:hypothetical protein
MEPDHEERAGAQESIRSGAWLVERVGMQRGQTTGQPVPARSSQELLSTLIALIRARFGDVAIGLGEHGIRYRAVAAR